MKKLFVFDFDGTLTNADTLLEFIRFACGRKRMLLGFLLYSPLLVLMKARLYPNYKAKQKVFAHFFKGMTLEQFDALCKAFARQGEHLLRPAAVRFIDEVRDEAHAMAIVSASIDNWVRPFFEIRNLKGVQVLGTQIEVVEGKLTGRFKSNNCYGAEKVCRITEALSASQTADTGDKTFLDRSLYEIEAFGDSRGDKEMLAFADQGHYKPFRE